MAKKVAKSDASALSADARLVLLAGKEPFLRLLYTRTLRDALEKAHGTVDVITYDGETAQASDVLDECRSMGLLAGFKLVVVDRAEQLIKESARPLFERFAQSLIDGTEQGATLVLRSDAWRAGNLDALIREAGAIIDCDPPSPEQAADWAVRRGAKEHACRLEPDAAALLVERVGPNLGRLDGELGKLAAAAAGKPVTPDLVREFVGDSHEEEAWSIQRALAAAPPAEALAQVRHMLDVTRQPATLLHYAATDLARKVHAAARAQAQGLPPGALFRPLKLYPGSAEPIFAAARRTSPAHALALFRAAVRADQRVKTGLSDPERALELLTLDMTRR